MIGAAEWVLYGVLILYILINLIVIIVGLSAVLMIWLIDRRPL